MAMEVAEVKRAPGGDRGHQVAFAGSIRGAQRRMICCGVCHSLPRLGRARLK